MRVYVRNRVYRDRLYVGAIRIDLDGKPAGVVTVEEVPNKATTPSVTTIIQKPRRLSLDDLRQAARQRS
jgi:sRNA-binding protein